MLQIKRRHQLLSGIACFALAATGAHADTPKEQELEARIAALEQLFGAVQSDLAATKAENQKLRAEAALAQARTLELSTSVEAIRRAPAPPPNPAPISAPADGFKVGATTVKLGGFLKTTVDFTRWNDGDVATGNLGRDFYLPQSTPISGQRESLDNDFNAKQTRLWLTTETAVNGHVLKGYVEGDFQTSPGTQGNERTTNGYNFALRRAYIQYDRFTFGEDWTTFQNVATLPESTDYIGPTESIVFARQALVRYSYPLSKTTTLHLAVENPETASANLGSPTLIENDDDSVPDFIVRLNHSFATGEVSVAGIARRLSVDNGAIGDVSSGYGLSVTGKMTLDTAKRYEWKFMATYGSGIGRYVGLNFAPDAVFVPATGQLKNVEILGGYSAIKVNWTPKLRSTLTGSIQTVDYDSGLALASLANFNKQAWSVSANLFYSPIKGVDLGAEYRHGVREVVSGADGSLDRLEFLAKYSF
ncbi:DcaP family trimeric outer membrane transporter [Aquidulcibacter paucihalophilus]|uniref:DcaP family trimeric outer membrane transporter n=1 Tax=Aquidulcibacter paucihalophilus TaxID=1978549 RepID=UPI000A197473|nr:DcaP family trimeric outer membrane transporter [Aquidulcibacter paucihalophilus]